jgi:hypothetical protein
MPGLRRKVGRAVECTSLENWRGCEPFVSSNLTPSAKNTRKALISLRFQGFFVSNYQNNIKLLNAALLNE